MSNRKKKPINNYMAAASGVTMSEVPFGYGPKVIAIDLTKELPPYIKHARLDIKVAGVVHSLDYNRP